MPGSGVRYSMELERRLAAQWGHYQIHKFLEMDGDIQADIIATYRAANQIEGVLAFEQAKKNKPRGGGGKR